MHSSQAAKKLAIALLTFLTTAENLDYYPLSMHASRFTFAVTYRYYFTGSGYADGVLTTQ